MGIHETRGGWSKTGGLCPPPEPKIATGLKAKETEISVGLWGLWLNDKSYE